MHAPFDSAFLARLEHFALRAQRPFHGQQRAERRSRRRGASLEFADYRNYTPGDDLRSLDWNLYGRLDRFYVKLYEEEEELPVHVLVDASASMRWQPENEVGTLTKFDLARRLAALLVYVGLAHLDHVHIHWLDGAAVSRGTSLDLGRGKAQFHRALDFLARDIPEARVPDFSLALRQFSGRVKRRGLVVLLSDLFDPAEKLREGLEAVLNRGFDLQLVHVLHPAELSPALTGDLRLSDAEGGAPLDVTSNETLLREYETAFRAFLTDIEQLSRRRRVPYLRALTTESLDDLFLRGLRLAGFIR